MSGFAGGGIGIVELGEVCDRQLVVSLGWFATLGSWVRDEPPGPRQRLWATACHRHAWHADLWSDRRPTIPPLGDPPARSPATDPLADTVRAARAGVYRTGLAELTTSLAAVRERLDDDLDPSTLRVVDLVAADLDDLTQRLEGIA